MSGPEVLKPTQPGWSSPDLPLLIWRGRVPVGDPDAIEATLAGNGWQSGWRDGVYPFHHFHSTAHEALACTVGPAELTLGGPDGQRITIEAGDLLVLPGGTGHRGERASPDFVLVGAYPDGQRWDVCREAADEAALARIAKIPVPSADPLEGGEGALTHLWRDR